MTVMGVPFHRHAYRITALAAVCLTFLVSEGVASPVDVIFTIDPTQSTQTWSGTDNSYGAFQAQSPGSLSTPVSGNFVVSFDPTTDNPSTIQFVGGSTGGYYQLANGVNSALPGGQPANLAGTTSGGQVQFAIQNLSYNLNSSSIPAASTSGLTETFSGTSPVSTNYLVLSGGAVYQLPNGASAGTSSDYVGSTGALTTGTWTLSESAPGSGKWTLGLVGSVNYTYNDGATSGTFTAAGNFVATASYSVANNTSSVPAGSQTVTVPGSNPNNAVTATLPSGSTGGTLSVQQLPGITSLTQAAINAAQNLPVFALADSEAGIGSAATQIWQVDYTRTLNGTATLIFDFTPPPGVPLSDLGIWHFNETLNGGAGAWQFLTGSIVDSYSTLGYDTITVTTNSFSPMVLGTLPEPSTIMLALSGLVPLAGFFGYRRRRATPGREPAVP